MRSRSLLFVVAACLVGFALGYLARTPSGPSPAPTPPLRAPEIRRGPEIRIDPDTIQLLPDHHLVIDAGAPPQLPSAVAP